jgi:hypothetical protein
MTQIQRVTHQQLQEQIVQDKKNSFIAAFKASHSNITHSVEKIGIGRQTYYDWLEKDPEFAMAVLHAQEAMTDQIRANLISEATEMKDMTAIIFYLKHKDPSFKEERNQVNVQVNNNTGELAEAIKAIASKLI